MQKNGETSHIVPIKFKTVAFYNGDICISYYDMNILNRSKIKHRPYFHNLPQRVFGRADCTMKPTANVN